MACFDRVGSSAASRSGGIHSFLLKSCKTTRTRKEKSHPNRDGFFLFRKDQDENPSKCSADANRVDVAPSFFLVCRSNYPSITSSSIITAKPSTIPIVAR